MKIYDADRKIESSQCIYLRSIISRSNGVVFESRVFGGKVKLYITGNLLSYSNLTQRSVKYLLFSPISVKRERERRQDDFSFDVKKSLL